MEKKWPALLLAVMPLYAYAKNSIELPLAITSESQKIAYNVSLDTLQINVLYKITCRINKFEHVNVKLLFEPRLLASSSYGNVELNGHPLPGNTSYLQTGQNQLTFRVLIEKEDTEKYNRFVLSNALETPYEVEQCLAYQQSPTSDALKTNMAANSDGGYFFAYNDTDRLVTIAVGNFWPTAYEIKPHDWKIVFVSTDNQNIHIKQIK